MSLCIVRHYLLLYTSIKLKLADLSGIFLRVLRTGVLNASMFLIILSSTHLRGFELVFNGCILNFFQ